MHSLVFEINIVGSVEGVVGGSSLPLPCQSTAP